MIKLVCNCGNDYSFSYVIFNEELDGIYIRCENCGKDLIPVHQTKCKGLDVFGIIDEA